ncbi:MAG: sprT domain-containing protein [Flavobacteriaceae bacterium]|nr:MAG: sprT domain-containing protein [Flavobacteriaceae bacterium]
MRETLAKYIPEGSIDKVIALTKLHPTYLKIVGDRKTKYGDFRVLSGKNTQITINYNLNPYQFLFTLIHEFAHLVTHKKYGHVQPHGPEWKHTFQHLMLPFLNPDVFPQKLLPYMARHLKNPKASTGADVYLTYALKQYDKASDLTPVFKIPENGHFIFNKALYLRGRQRRTRIECINLKNKKTYLFNLNAEVLPFKQ